MTSRFALLSLLVVAAVALGSSTGVEASKNLDDEYDHDFNNSKKPVRIPRDTRGMDEKQLKKLPKEEKRFFKNIYFNTKYHKTGGMDPFDFATHNNRKELREETQRLMVAMIIIGALVAVSLLGMCIIVYCCMGSSEELRHEKIEERRRVAGMDTADIYGRLRGIEYPRH